MKKILTSILSNWVTFILLVVTIILCVMVVRSCNKRNESEKKAVAISTRIDTIVRMANSLHDTVQVVKTINSGNMISDSLEFYRKLAATTAAVKDKEIERLTKLSVVISQNTKTSIDTIIKTDSIMYPIYKYKFQSNWLSYDAIARRDSLLISPLNVRDSIDLILALKKQVLEARIVNYNPYSRIEWARDYDFRKFSKPKNWGIGVSFGATYYNNKIQPYIGAGINYNLIRF